jgi:hypothetical protein
MQRPDNIIEALTSPSFFGPAFKNLSSWRNWLTFLKTIYGIPLDAEELEVFRQCTERSAPLQEGFREVYAICGRRGGKSRIMAVIAVFEALWGNWAEGLAPGENAFIFLLATDRTQAGVCFRYVKGLLDLFPDEVEKITTDEITLKNRVTICVKTASFQSSRGFSTAVILLDELAFFRSDNSAQPVDELVAALMPSLLPNGFVIGASTPYTPSGYLYEMYDEYYGHDEAEVLCWKAGTRVMNPSYSESFIKKLFRRDKVKYEAEYNAEFRSDVDNFLSAFLVSGAMHGRQALPEPDRHYEAFADASGGRVDSYTLAIGYTDREKSVVVRVEERIPPFDPAQVTKEYAELLTAYGIKTVKHDRYAGAWVSSAFEKNGIKSVMSELSASDLYLEFQAQLSMGRVVLYEHDKLSIQLQQLERRVRQGGRDQVTHPDGGHDDVANAVAGLVVTLHLRHKWSLAEMEKKLLPHVQTHYGGLPEPMARAIKAKEDLRDNQTIMDEFMRDGGGNIIVKDRKGW